MAFSGSDSKEESDLENGASPTTAETHLRDGGAFAWLQCAGAFLLFFNSWGLVNAFGK